MHGRRVHSVGGVASELATTKNNQRQNQLHRKCRTMKTLYLISNKPMLSLDVIFYLHIGLWQSNSSRKYFV